MASPSDATLPTPFLPGVAVPASGASRPPASPSRGGGGTPPPDTAPPALADLFAALLAEVKGLRADEQALRSEVQALRTDLTQRGERSDILARLMCEQATPVIQIGFTDYVNTLGTTRIVNELKASQGQALIITRIRPRFFVLTNSQLVLIADPYTPITGTDSGRFASLFQVSVDGGKAGEFSLRNRNIGAGETTDSSGLGPSISVTELLGWESGLYTAYVRGGGQFRVTNVVNAVITAAGATIPQYIGCEVGGYRVPEQIALRIMGR